MVLRKACVVLDGLQMFPGISATLVRDTGMWLVCVPGFYSYDAVVDDYGNLVRVA